MRYSAIFFIAILCTGFGFVNSERTKNDVSSTHTFDITQSALRQVAAEHKLQKQVDVQDVDPLFEHHIELMRAIATKQIRFEAVSVNFSSEYRQQLTNGEVEKRPIRLVNGSFSLFGENKYVSLDLDHVSTRIYDLGSNHVVHCHNEIVESSINQGDFIVGSEDGNWLDSPASKHWKIHRQSNAGLLVIRRAVAVHKIISTEADRGYCHHIETEDIHPMELIQQANVSVQSVPPEVYEYHPVARNSSSSHRRLRGETTNMFTPDSPLLACNNYVFSSSQNSFLTYFGPYSYGNNYYIVFGDNTGCISIDYSLASFTFNFANGAVVNPRIPLEGTYIRGVDCVDCYFYLGASIQAIFEYVWDSTYRYYKFYMEVKLIGSTGFNARIEIVNPSISGSIVIPIISPSSDSFYSSILIYSGIYLSYKPGGLKAVISGTGSATGTAYMGAGFSAYATFGVVYNGPSNSVSFPFSYYYSYNAPYFQNPVSFTAVSCSIDVQFIATENFKLSFGQFAYISGLFDMNLLDGVKYASTGALQTSISINLGDSSPVLAVPASKPKNGIQQSTIGIYTPGSTMVMDVSYSSFEPNEEHLLFFTMEKIDEAFNVLESLPVLQTSFSSQGNGTEKVKWRIPWDVRFFGSTSRPPIRVNLWKISVHSSNLMSRLVESPPFVIDPHPESVSLVLKPHANEIVLADTLYEIQWDGSLLCTFLDDAGTGGHGTMTTVDKVIIEVQVGAGTGAGGELPSINSTLNRRNLTSLEGVENSGRALVVFPGALLEYGKEFSVIIRSSRYSNLFGWSMGVFSINNGSGNSVAIPKTNITHSRYISQLLSERIFGLQSTEQHSMSADNSLLASVTCPGKNSGILAYDTRIGNQINGLSMNLLSLTYNLALAQPVITELTVVPASSTYICIAALTDTPTMTPISSPTLTPIRNPTMTPISSPTMTPIRNPTMTPISSPTMTPIRNPTLTPISSPTLTPISSPTMTPIRNPTMTPIS
eukprot:gene13286-28131_t